MVPVRSGKTAEKSWRPTSEEVKNIEQNKVEKTKNKFKELGKDI